MGQPALELNPQPLPKGDAGTYAPTLVRAGPGHPWRVGLDFYYPAACG